MFSALHTLSFRRLLRFDWRVALGKYREPILTKEKAFLAFLQPKFNALFTSLKQLRTASTSFKKPQRCLLT